MRGVEFGGGVQERVDVHGKKRREREIVVNECSKPKNNTCTRGVWHVCVCVCVCVAVRADTSHNRGREGVNKQASK